MINPEPIPSDDWAQIFPLELNFVFMPYLNIINISWQVEQETIVGPGYSKGTLDGPSGGETAPW